MVLIYTTNIEKLLLSMHLRATCATCLQCHLSIVSVHVPVCCNTICPVLLSIYLLIRHLSSVCPRTCWWQNLLYSALPYYVPGPLSYFTVPIICPNYWVFPSVFVLNKCNCPFSLALYT